MRASDLQGLALDPDDIEALKTCREGTCELQLPAGSIRTFRDRVNWSGSHAVDEANGVARELLIELVNAYRLGGNDALGAYRDKSRPALVAKQFETLVEHTAAVPDVLPELRDYLLHYPHAALPGADTLFYWEKVSFGLKPTIRLNQVVIYHTARDSREIDVVAIKQLYATHYFHTALDVSVCVSDDTSVRSHGFNLLNQRVTR